MVEDARQAKSLKQANRFEHAILVSEVKLRKYVEDTVDSSEMIKSAKEPPGRTTWDNYPQRIKDIKGWYYDVDTQKIKECTMEDYTYNISVDRSAWLIGSAGTGKSELQRVWARFMCRSDNKSQYLEGKSIDPLGLLSRNGMLKEMGVLCLSDFDFKTLQNTRLTMNGIKSLVAVGEVGSCAARYGCAQFPPDMARLFLVNLGENEATRRKDDPAAFFIDNYLTGMEHLVRKDQQSIKDMKDDTQLAIVRRSVVFILDRSMDLQIDKAAMASQKEDRMAKRKYNREMHRQSTL